MLAPHALDEETSFELLKLLLQVAFADHELLPAERAWLEGLAAQRVSASKRDQLTRWLDRADPLPAPDLGALRAHRGEVMREAVRMMRADGSYQPDEQQLIAQLQTLLGE